MTYIYVMLEAETLRGINSSTTIIAGGSPRVVMLKLSWDIHGKKTTSIIVISSIKSPNQLRLMMVPREELVVVVVVVVADEAHAHVLGLMVGRNEAVARYA